MMDRRSGQRIFQDDLGQDDDRFPSKSNQSPFPRGRDKFVGKRNQNRECELMCQYRRGRTSLQCQRPTRRAVFFRPFWCTIRSIKGEHQRG